MRIFRKKFKCDRCGCCCKKVGALLKAHDAGTITNAAVADFPYSTVDGVCEMYKEGVGCKVYKNRPLLCNVYKYWKTFHKDDVTAEEFYEINKGACRELRILDNEKKELFCSSEVEDNV
jgi:Fe-S-cluster containining protein